jgi:hypothetical protein
MPVMTPKQGTHRKLGPGPRSSHPRVHANIVAAPALAAPDQERAAALIEIAPSQG